MQEFGARPRAATGWVSTSPNHSDGACSPNLGSALRGMRHGLTGAVVECAHINSSKEARGMCLPSPTGGGTSTADNASDTGQGWSHSQKEQLLGATDLDGHTAGLQGMPLNRENTPARAGPSRLNLPTPAVPAPLPRPTPSRHALHTASHTHPSETTPCTGNWTSTHN
ncbi:unnamed protein product [Gadus morhua 'NCC']